MNSQKQYLPTVSIVIPAYNEEKYIDRCLESIKKQTYSQNLIDVIVSDNNSSDETIYIAKKYGAQIVEEPRQGYTYALARGLNYAKGDILVSIDADTYAFPNWIEKIVKAYENPQVVGLTGSCVANFKSSVVRSIMTALYSSFLTISFMFKIPNLSGFNMSVRRDMYEKVGGLNTDFQMSPDVDLGKRLAKVGKVIYVPNAKVITSTRRWETNFLQTLHEYTMGYIFVNVLGKPPPVKQKIFR